MRFARAFMIVALAALPGTALAQTVCPEGKTFSGTCVKPDLAYDTSMTVRAMAQPKISYMAPPVLPQEDGYYTAMPRDTGELRRIYGIDRAKSCTLGGFIVPVWTCN